MTSTNRTSLVGEIVDGRFALLESRGPARGGFRFQAFDMESLAKTELVIFLDGEKVKGYLALKPDAPAPQPARAEATPPPLPVEVERQAEPTPPPLPAAVTDERLEAAWFISGEEIEFLAEEEIPLEDFVPEDYVERQERLEGIAKTLSLDILRRYTLKLASC